jgi:serine/threonine protein phosphatase PrpC
VVSAEDAAEVLDEANIRLYEAMYGQLGRPGMGTTVVGLVAIGERLLVFNIGDSRAYAFAGGVLTRLTVDHSVEMASGKSAWLTQSLGGTGRRRALMPSITWTTPHQAPTLLLCTDGLTNFIPDDEVAELMKRHRTNPAEALVEAALEAGGGDNITVVVVSALKDK